ncbi:NAD(P)H-dependent oxidoreductase subunit E, partial [Aminobacterium sp. UBA5277]|uniref:NADH-quinone oxidoreductase subunit NuoE family protein n=1 Tax=Aminobacterium sp. UBA5277 TaxID=1946029 RepID=UPI00258105EC
KKHTTDDLLFTLETVSCLGACGLAPVMVVDNQTFGRLAPDMVAGMLAKFE